MSNVEVRLNNTEIANLMRGTDGPAWVAAQRLGNQVRNLARDTYVPVRNGGLRRSIELEMRNEGGPVAYVGANIEYAVYVHQGFTHRGGKKIAGRPFLLQALNDVMARAKGK